LRTILTSIEGPVQAILATSTQAAQVPTTVQGGDGLGRQSRLMSSLRAYGGEHVKAGGSTGGPAGRAQA
jgi:hypothetical protein